MVRQLKFRRYNMVKIEIDNEKCEGCGECVDICPSEVYEIKDEKSVPVNMDECVECCSCVEVCPNDAISHDSC
jgi:NAD-dependent dihydropyrimidine dehydrogenase PreA subunit